MKNIISKEDLLKKIRGNGNRSEDTYIITNTYTAPPFKPLCYIRSVPPLPNIKVDPENHPELEINLSPGIYITGANRVYQISEISRAKDQVKAILLGYDKSKSLYSFTIGSTHEFKMEEFTSEFWIGYYDWRRANEDELIRYNPSSVHMCPGSVIYDFKEDGYFRFLLNSPEMHQIGVNGEYFHVLKAYLVYSDNPNTRKTYKDTLKEYTRAPMICSTIPNSPQPLHLGIDYRPIDNKEYIELVTGIKNLELEKSRNPITPMNFLLDCLSKTGIFRMKGIYYYITRIEDTEVRCVEVTKGRTIIHHTFNFKNLPINHG